MAESLYSEHIAKMILFDPVSEGADRLCILTAHATPSMASWLLTSYDERGISNERRNFSCSYVCLPPPEEQNCYIWLDHERPVKAFVSSYEFTQTSLLREGYGVVTERVAEYVYRIYEEVIERSIYCNHSEVEDFVIVHSPEAGSLSDFVQDDENCVRLSLLARGGETGRRSGLNWGHRGSRNKNEAYIPLPSYIAKTNFFPLNNQHFLVVTDDHHTLQLRVEQQNDKAITTPASNAQLGEYFRNRLGLANGTFVEKRHLIDYGRTDVTFYKIDEEQYYMDFSVRNER